MTRRIIILSLIFFSSSQNMSCFKKTDTCQWTAEPPVFFMQIKNAGQRLPDSITKDIKILYVVNGNNKYISDLTPAIDYYSNMGILTSRQIGTFENQTFFIIYPNSSDIDTLLVKNLMPSPNTNCQYKTEEVKFNKTIAIYDSTLTYQHVYVCIK